MPNPTLYDVVRMAVLTDNFVKWFYPEFLNLFPKVETYLYGVDVLAFYSALPVVGA
jgi:hypothetical protein